ncbi:MAG: STAS domain-containing protein, partial [Bacteroidota bacterium]
HRSEFWMLLITFLATILLGIISGILVGVGIALFFLVFRTAKPHMTILGNIEGHYKNIERFPDCEQRPDVLAFRFDGQLYYANQNYFETKVCQWIEEKGSELKLVVMNAESINYLDATAGAMLEDLVRRLQQRGVDFRLAGAIGPVRDILKRTGLYRVIGEDHYFVRTGDAIRHFDDPNTPIKDKIAKQTGVE